MQHFNILIFSHRCGYKFCKPVTASSGTVGIRQGMFDGKSHLDLLLEKDDPKKNLDDDLLPSRNDDLGLLCAKVFIEKPQLPDQEPVIRLPLRALNRDSLKTDKSSICKAGIHKDFMKKWL